MSLGGGGGVSSPDYGQMAALNKEMFEYQKEVSKPWMDAGANRALPTLMYEFGLGPKPFLTPDGEVVFENTDGTYSGGAVEQVAEAPEQNSYWDQLDSMQRWWKDTSGGLGESPHEVAYVDPQGNRHLEADYYNEMSRIGRLAQEGGPRGAMQSDAQGGAAQGASGVMASLPEGSTELGGYQKTPGYDFRMQEGQRGLMSSMNAAGVGKDSGSTLKAMTRYSQDYATNDYNRYLSGVSQIAGYGQFGAGLSSQAAGQYANNNMQVGAMQQSAYDAQQARNASSMAGIGQLAGTVIGGIGGFAVGAPAGAMAGAQLGGGAGGAVFS